MVLKMFLNQLEIGNDCIFILNFDFSGSKPGFYTAIRSHCLKFILMIEEKNDVDEACNKKLYFYLLQEI